MANFGPKPWTNPFGKNNLSFLAFVTSCFHTLERLFFLLQYRKTHSPGNIKMGKWTILDKNHGLTTLEKSQFFDFLNFFFL